MFQKLLLTMTFFIIFGDQAKALSSLDHHVMTHCGLACNGESDDCEECYNEAVDMYDQSQPKIGFEF